MGSGSTTLLTIFSRLSHPPPSSLHVSIESFAVKYLLHFAGHLPTENGLPPYSTSNTSTNAPTSSTNSGPTNTTANFNEQHNVSRLSSSPSLSVHSGPSPIPSSSTPTHIEQPTLTPMKSMPQNQENSMDKVILDMQQHMEGSRSTYFDGITNLNSPCGWLIARTSVLARSRMGRFRSKGCLWG